MLAVILTDSLSPECLPIMVKGVSFIEGPAVLWNNLSLSVTEAATLPSFKKITVHVILDILLFCFIVVVLLLRCILCTQLVNS